MLGNDLPEEHHISRYCSPSSINKFHGLPTAAAFMLRKTDDFLSVNWLDYFNKGDINLSIDCVRQVFIEKGFQIKANGRFVSLNVGDVISVIYSHLQSSDISIKHLPVEDDPSHSGVFGYTQSDNLIALKISQLVRAKDVHAGR